MNAPVTLIIFGPSGAGKSARVKNYERAPGFYHLSRDEIQVEIQRQLRRSLPSTDAQTLAYILDRAIVESKPIFLERFHSALRRQIPLIVIDYASIESTDWVRHIVNESYSAGHHVVVDAMWVDPIVAQCRILEAGIASVIAKMPVGVIARTLTHNQYIRRNE